MGKGKYRTILEMLKKDIRDGKYASGQSFPSVRALSRRFDLAATTVQRAVEELARLGLIQSTQGAGSTVTRAGALRKIGLLVPGVAYCEIYPPIIGEISRLSHENDMCLSIADIPYSRTKAWAHNARKAARDLVEAGVAGVIFQPLESVAGADECNRDILSVFGRAHVSVVLIGYDVVRSPGRSEYDVVGINNIDAGSRIAEHLVSRGARRIHMFERTGADSPSGTDRMRGIAMALGDGMFSPARNVLCAETDDLAKIRRYVKRHRPDAFICSNDAEAASFRLSLSRIGIDVPRDMLLAGFDDVNVARLTRLTTIRQPCEGIARVAFSRLLERLRTSDMEPLELFLSAPLVERESTRPVRQDERTKK